MAKYIKMVLVLLVIATFSGLILSIVNDYTKDKIAANEAAKITNGITEIFADAKQNQVVDLAPNTNKNINEVRAVYSDDAKTTLIGYAFVVKAPGSYSGELRILVGVDATGHVLGYSQINMPETPGVGSKIFSNSYAWFKNQFTGLTVTNGNWVDENGQAATVDTITSATYSSSSVVNGIQLAVVYYNQNLAE